MIFEEEKHPRDEDGKFSTNGRDGKATETEKQIRAAKKYSSDPKRDLEKLGIGDKKTLKLSKQEYATLSALAIAQHGHKSGIFQDYSFNANAYYVYKHLGDGYIVPIIKLSIGKDSKKISRLEEVLNGFNKNRK